MEHNDEADDQGCEHQGMMLPALNYRRPDELNDHVLMTMLDIVSAQWRARTIPESRITEWRADVYAAIDRPGTRTWSGAYLIPIWKAGTVDGVALWNLLLEHTNYSEDAHVPGSTWRVVPSGGQIAKSLALFFGVQPAEPEHF